MSSENYTEMCDVSTEALGKFVLKEFQFLRSEMKKEFNILGLKVDQLLMAKLSSKAENNKSSQNVEKHRQKRQLKFMDKVDTFSISSSDIDERDNVIDITDYFEDLPGVQSNTIPTTSNMEKASSASCTQGSSSSSKAQCVDDSFSDDEEISSSGTPNLCKETISTPDTLSVVIEDCLSQANDDSSDFSSLESNHEDKETMLPEDSNNNYLIEKSKSPAIITITPSCDVVKKMIQCPKCDQIGHCSQAMLFHIQNHSNKRPARCFLCKESYRRRIDMQEHMKFHAREYVYQCKYCLKIFRKKQNMSSHVTQVHRPDNIPSEPFTPKTHNYTYKIYKCGVCDKTYTQESEARVHMRIHTGERPFECMFCCKTFIRSEHLARHHRTHTGEKPYKCKLCPQKFSDTSAVQSHMRKKHLFC